MKIIIITLIIACTGVVAFTSTVYYSWATQFLMNTLRVATGYGWLILCGIGLMSIAPFNYLMGMTVAYRFSNWIQFNKLTQDYPSTSCRKVLITIFFFVILALLIASNSFTSSDYFTSQLFILPILPIKGIIYSMVNFIRREINRLNKVLTHIEIYSHHNKLNEKEISN